MKIEIDTIAELHAMSVRAYNVCKDNELNDLDSLLIYYRENETFLNLNKTGRKTDTELINICEYYLDSSYPKSSISGICISEKYNIETVEYLRNEGIQSLDDILKRVELDFISLPVEVKKTVLKYDFYNRKIDAKKFYSLGLNNSSLKSNLDKSQIFKIVKKDEIIALLKIRGEKFSRRSQNIIGKIIKEVRENQHSILDYSNEKKVRSIKNVGSKSLKELIPFLHEIISIIQKIESGEIDSSAMKITHLESVLGYPFNSLKKWLDSENLQLKNKLPLLSLAQFHINQTISADKLEIVDRYFKERGEYGNNILEQLGEKYGLSRERIRQLKNNTVKEIEKNTDNLRRVIELFEIKVSKYFDDDNSMFSIGNIILNEKISLPENIVFKILETLHSDKKLIINNTKKSYFKYLCPAWIVDSIDFNKLNSYVESKLKEKIERTYKIRSKELLKLFSVKTIVVDDVPKIERILNPFLQIEYGVSLSEGMIIFRRNTKKKTYEYIEEIIQKTGVPMHVDDILPEVNKIFPNKQKTPEGIRSHCLNHPEVFINTSWSTYGLKTWENQGKQVGGTIKQVVVKYLEQFDEPKHIYEISKYVTQFRDTNQNSIWGNINLDPKGFFKVFNGGFVGLTNKEYLKKNTLFNNVLPNWFYVFKTDFLVNGRSQINVERLYIKLSNKLNVQPIQIEALISERIEKGELTIDHGGYLFLKEELKPVFVESYILKRNYLDEVSLENIRSKILQNEHLEALSICLNTFKKLSIEITLKEAKRIIDTENDRLLT